ncbi:hypothetical protein C4D60_Mb09t03550 [Musa balbisiana]|uniref:PWI domain-containing protein n=1 Tax=Musa balbisiana TaxID=52838 RepID=A0A4S8IDR0_MUSBA|nr:hypothetical protein C4D60_Mb09t03550 [Musa balbisiana]
MSGGFFRGTSAEQDTRFSNKQAKLLKSQKFAAELDHPVDMTKVQMDVIRPWIATRVTELLGFEDEVLINFVYGLLDGKEVDGKQIQIQLTGFLEKNTGKFMKELWGLLLSAQNNASGVPQQFLNAKEEEMKKRKLESDRITEEIQKRKEKEGRDFEQGNKRRMDVEADNSRLANAISGWSSEHPLDKSSSVQPEKERDVDMRRSPILKGRNGRSRSVSVSSQSQGHSVSPIRQYHSPGRHSISSERRHKSTARSSISPRRRYSPRNNWSPSRHRSPYGRRGSPSKSRHRSPSLIQRRSSRSPSFLRRRSPSPSRHRSPVQSRRRSPSSIRRRRSPSPLRNRRSPSPMHRRRSPSPTRRRSPSPMHRRRSPSPVRRRRSPFPMRRRRSPSPMHRRRSPSLTRPRRSPSPTRSRRSPSLTHDKSPIRHRPLSSSTHGSLSPLRRPPPHKSPQQRKTSALHSPRIYRADSQVSLGARKRSRSPYMSSSPSNPARRDSSRETDRRTNGFDSKRYQDEYTSERVAKNAAKKTEKQRLHKSQGRNGKEEQASPVREDAHHRTELSSKKVDHSPGTRGHPTNVKLKQNESEHNSNMDLPTRQVRQVSSESPNEMEYDTKHIKRPKRKQDTSSQSNPSDLEGTDTHKNRSSEKRKHKKYDKHKKGSDNSSESESDSDTEAKKEAKRRRKEERRLRKEERRRKREEKHQKRLERRASKLKMRPMDTVMPPSDFDKEHSDAGKSDDHIADAEETQSEEKKLEIKLREKALESLRARKATSH